MNFLPHLKPPEQKRTILFCIILLLVSLTSIAYWNVDKLDFLSLDDPNYVYGNAPVKAGLTQASIKWAFLTTHASNWHPLTWISHMIDCQIYGLKPAGHHLTNAVFHVLTTVLLFLLFSMMTGSLAKSACVALLFGLHPLHVESVAWVSERKDVLSAFFMLLTMLSYVRFVKSKRRRFYFMAIAAFAVGLTAKPMLVTLPFALLLLDYWPLGRIRLTVGAEKSVAQHGAPWSLPSLLIEKIPFFILSFCSCVITAVAQFSGGAAATTERFHIAARICNAIVSYCAYCGKMLRPFDLAAFYPYGGIPSFVKTAGAAAILLGITIVLLRSARSRPYGIVGWLWYIGTLVPVIGFIQIGSQAMADRYTYIPSIGLFIIVTWAAFDIAKRLPMARPAMVAGAGIIFLLLTLQTRKQVDSWKNDLTVARQALAVTDRNYMALGLMGNYLFVHQNYDEAKQNYLQALSIRPTLDFARLNLGWICLQSKEYSEAIRHFSDVLSRDSMNFMANTNMGCIYERLHEPEKAAFYFAKAQESRPKKSGLGK